MKLATYSGLLILMFGFVGMACKDHEDTVCETNFLEADVNGLLWEASDVTGFGIFSVGGHVNVIAKADYGTVQQIDIQMPVATSPGQYNVDSNNGPYYLIVYPGGIPSDAGQLNITVFDTTTRVIKGTFEFSADLGDLQMKNGEFCVKY